jgi:hemolysin III
MAAQWTDENAFQEKINAWIHGLGFLASIPAGLGLIALATRQNPEVVFACGLYSLTFATMFLFSTLSHAVRNPGWRHRFRALDQGAIYLLISGSFTPFIWGYMEGWQRWALLAGVWLGAFAGFASKVFVRHRIDNMTSLYYVLLGWIPAMILLNRVPLGCFAIMALGGVIYTAGTRFLQNDHIRWYFHPIWHVAVIVAGACHFAAIVMFPVLHLES